MPHGSYEGVLKTKDWNPLDPGIVEHKYYARDVGTIFEKVVEGETGHLELLEMTQESNPPGQDDEEEVGDDEDAAGRPWTAT